jgi:hypothetical protein
MKRQSFLTFLWLAALCATWTEAQESRRRVGDTPDPDMQGTIYVSGSAWPQPDTFVDLCRTADLIVDGTVVGSLPVRRSIPDVPYTLETDALIAVNHVLKGPQNLTTIMVAESGGVQAALKVVNKDNALMVPQERYVLFLLKERRSTLPTMAGVPRYAVIANSQGKFLVENGAVQIITKAPSAVQSQYRGSGVGAFEAAIAASVGN